jgi:hypothetical protein
MGGTMRKQNGQVIVPGLQSKRFHLKTVAQIEPVFTNGNDANRGVSVIWDRLLRVGD